MPSTANFFMTASPLIFIYDTFELLHPSWPSPILFARNSLRQLVARDENGINRTYSYFPVTLEKAGLNPDLDYSLKLSIDDVGLVGSYVAPLSSAARQIKPTLIYRAYASNDLTTPLERYALRVEKLPMNDTTCTIEAVALRLNTNGTGRRYLLNDFHGLRPYV